MKILYVITSTDVGGAEKSLLELVRQVSKQHTVKVISLKPFGPLAAEMEKAGAAEVISLNMAYGGIGVVSALSAEINAFKPDIVHAMLYRAIQFARCACAAKPVKLVTTPHFDLSKKNFLLRWTDRFLKVVDKVSTAESKGTYSYLINQQKYNKNKVLYIGNAPEKGQFFPSQDIRLQMRKEYNFSPKNTIFISVARLEPVKNIAGLVRAFAQVYDKHPHIRLVLVGGGSQEKSLKALTRKLKLESIILFAGPQKNINDWLNMADVFVLNSIEESLPISLLEALQVGKPCLVSQTGDMPLWVEQGKNGYSYVPQSKTLLCCFLDEFATKKAASIEKMGAKSLQIAAKIKDTSQQYQQLYKQLTEESFHVKTLK